MEAGEYGLTRGTCFVACRREVVAVAGLLWISLCFGCRRDSFFFLFFFLNAHDLLQVLGRLASFTSVLVVMRRIMGVSCFVIHRPCTVHSLNSTSLPLPLLFFHPVFLDKTDNQQCPGAPFFQNTLFGSESYLVCSNQLVESD